MKPPNGGYYGWYSNTQAQCRKDLGIIAVLEYRLVGRKKKTARVTLLTRTPQHTCPCTDIKYVGRIRDTALYPKGARRLRGS